MLGKLTAEIIELEATLLEEKYRQLRRHIHDKHLKLRFFGKLAAHGIRSKRISAFARRVQANRNAGAKHAAFVSLQRNFFIVTNVMELQAARELQRKFEVFRRLFRNRGREQEVKSFVARRNRWLLSKYYVALDISRNN